VTDDREKMINFFQQHKLVETRLGMHRQHTIYAQ